MNDTSTLERAARPFGLVAALILVFMMLFTTVSVAMRQFFDTPVLGVVDIMELSLVGLIFVAMPGVFFRDENVAVDIIDHGLPRSGRVVLRYVGLVLALGFLVMMFWQMIPQAYDKWQFHEVTMTLSINRFIHWTPIIFGFALSIVATVWVIVHYIRFGVPKDPNLDADLDDRSFE